MLIHLKTDISCCYKGIHCHIFLKSLTIHFQASGPSFRMWSFNQLCPGSKLGIDLGSFVQLGNSGDSIEYNVTRLGTSNGRQVKGLDITPKVVANGQFVFGQEADSTKKQRKGKKARTRSSTRCPTCATAPASTPSSCKRPIS